MIEKPQNVLEFVEYLLNPINWNEFIQLQDHLLNNKFVKLARLRPTSQQLYEYFSWLKKGFLFASQRFGKECLPTKLTLYSAPVVKEVHPDFIAYIPQLDELAIGILRVASDASVKSAHEWIRDAGFDRELRACDRTMLIAIEECFHRYQIKVLGRPLPEKRFICSEEDPDEPLESEADQVLKEIMVELNIKHRRHSH